MKLSEVAPFCSINVEVDGEFKSLGKAGHRLPQMLVFMESDYYLIEVINNEQVSCVITTPELVSDFPEGYGIGTAENPRDAFYQVHEYLHSDTHFYWRDYPSEVSPGAEIDPTAVIATKNVRIGSETIVEAGVVINERVQIGEKVILRAGSLLGTEGFEVRKKGDELIMVPHAGGLLIEDSVEVQAGCAIDRAIFNDNTVIGFQTKIDNLVHIAHNVKIGRGCRIAAGTVISGNVFVGDDVYIGPKALISNGLMVGNGARVTLGSVVVRNVPEGETVTGYFATQHKDFLAGLRQRRKHQA